MLNVIKFWREILIVLLMLSTYVLGNLYRKKPTKVQVPVLVEKVVEVEKIVERTVTKVVTTLPDGTTIVKDETKDTAKDTSKDNSKQTTPVVVKLNPYRYSAGLLVKFDYNDNDKKHYVLDVGARLADSPIVAVLSYDITPKTFALGVRYEF